MHCQKPSLLFPRALNMTDNSIVIKSMPSLYQTQTQAFPVVRLNCFVFPIDSPALIFFARVTTELYFQYLLYYYGKPNIYIQWGFFQDIWEILFFMIVLFAKSRLSFKCTKILWLIKETCQNRLYVVCNPWRVFYNLAA